MKHSPVDAVITWVDAQEKGHYEKLIAHLNKLGVERNDSVAQTRYNQVNEISYCVQSILIHAPWIRTIYIVTDNQTPSIYHQLQHTEHADKIKIIDHRHIFRDFEQYLPTFNSLAIETLLWRIDTLADEFISFDDDVILVRPIEYEDFFQEEHVILKGEMKGQFYSHWYRKLQKSISNVLPCSFNFKVPSAHRMYHEKAARLAGFKKTYFHLDHAPFPLKKQWFEDFFTKNNELLKNNIQYAFRNERQFCPYSLMYHQQIQADKFVYKNIGHEITIHPSQHSFKKIKEKLAQCEADVGVKFVCLQSLDEASPEILSYLMDWIKERTQLGLNVNYPPT